MSRALCWIIVAMLLLPARGEGQTVLVPTDQAPYRQKFDLAAQDLEILLLPQSPLPLDQGPYRFRFVSPRLDSLLTAPPAVSYLSVRPTGLLLQVLHLRARSPAPEMLGPQPFTVRSASGEEVGSGVLLVTGRTPEAVELVTEEGGRTLELGREVPVTLRLQGHGNFAGVSSLANPQDFAAGELRVVDTDSGGVVTLATTLRPLREEAGELRLAVETLDGRTVEVVYSDLRIRAPLPQRVTIGGGPIYLDETGNGAARVTVLDLPRELRGRPEVVDEPRGSVRVMSQRFDRERHALEALLEVEGRGPPAAGFRETREVRIRAGTQSFRGMVEVVGAPSVTAIRVQGSERPVLPIGGGPVTVHVAGKNLDGLRLECGALGAGAACRTVSSSPDELVAEISVSAPLREGEHPLRLQGEPGRDTERPARQASLSVRAEYPAVPAPLSAARFLRLGCGGVAGCRVGRDGESLVVRAASAGQLRLEFDDQAVPREHGWQKLLASVTRVRGDQRQTVRSFGTPLTPRLLRNGSDSGDLVLLDASVDPRHGDLFLVRVEHAIDQYPAAYRAGLASAEAFVRRVYIDGGPSKRLAGDIVVQPVLFALAGDSAGVTPLYPNAGLGLTWQFLNDRVEPRAYSVKLQALLTDLQSTEKGKLPGRPALFLSGNLRIPGSDPNRPLVLTTGVARMLGDEPGWRVLMGAGIDLGVAHMIFGR